MASAVLPVTSASYAFPISSIATGVGNAGLINAYQQQSALRVNQDAFFIQAAVANNNTAALETSLVSLDPESLDLLNGVGGVNINSVTSNISVPANGSVSANDNTGSPVQAAAAIEAEASARTALSAQQQDTVAGIIDQFANAPFTTQTLIQMQTQIQAFLASQGFNPLQLSLQDVLLPSNSSAALSEQFYDHPYEYSTLDLEEA